MKVRGCSWTWAWVSKTVIALTAIDELIYERFEVSRVLVIAPKRVAEDTWSREHEKWDHLGRLQISKVLGTPAQRKAALEEEADVYVIGRDNTQWIVDYCWSLRNWPFDMIVIDELSSFKSSKSKRFKKLKKVAPLTDRVVGLTGTPSANGLMDLWAEMYLLDGGMRLGRTITDYRQTYFKPGASNGHVVYRWDPLKHAQAIIEKKISDICISMSAKDYLQLPERIDNVIKVRLSDDEMDRYKTMEREQLLRLEDDQGDDHTVVALSAAAVMSKLLQIANGRVYDDDGNVVMIHDAKLDTLRELVDTAQEPALVFYSFRHDADAIREAFPDAVQMSSSDDIADWNAGKIRILLAHPASAGYGLNLQEGGHIVIWYGLTWSLEQYQQANARLYRQGQEKPVIVHHLIAEGTVDKQVMAALKRKDTSQAALLEALKERKG